MGEIRDSRHDLSITCPTLTFLSDRMLDRDNSLNDCPLLHFGSLTVSETPA